MSAEFRGTKYYVPWESSSDDVTVLVVEPVTNHSMVTDAQPSDASELSTRSTARHLLRGQRASAPCAFRSAPGGCGCVMGHGVGRHPSSTEATRRGEPTAQEG